MSYAPCVKTRTFLLGLSFLMMHGGVHAAQLELSGGLLFRLKAAADQNGASLTGQPGFSVRGALDIPLNKSFGLRFWGEVSPQSWQVPASTTLDPESTSPFGVGAAIQILFSPVVFWNLGGGLSQVHLLTAPSTTSLALSGGNLPFFYTELGWTALPGINHDITLLALGGVTLPGSAGSLSVTQGFYFGGEVLLDFRQGGLPFGIYANIIEGRYVSSGGSQSDSVMTVGARIFWGLVGVSSENRRQYAPMNREAAR